MTRPALVDVDHGQEDADATINNNNDKITAGPFPVMEYADFASLPAAGGYDRCLAATTSPTALWISNGTEWVAVGAEVATTELTGLTGATVTWTGAFPAGVRQIGVSGRVTTLITASGGGTTLNVGDHGSADPDRYAAGVAFAANTVFSDAATADPGGWNSGARDVVISPDAGAFTAGAVRLRAYFLRTIPPRS